MLYTSSFYNKKDPSCKVHDEPYIQKCPPSAWHLPWWWYVSGLRDIKMGCVTFANIRGVHAYIIGNTH